MRFLTIVALAGGAAAGHNSRVEIVSFMHDQPTKAALVADHPPIYSLQNGPNITYGGNWMDVTYTQADQTYAMHYRNAVFHVNVTSDGATSTILTTIDDAYPWVDTTVTTVLDGAVESSSVPASAAATATDTLVATGSQTTGTSADETASSARETKDSAGGRNAITVGGVFAVAAVVALVL